MRVGGLFIPGDVVARWAVQQPNARPIDFTKPLDCFEQERAFSAALNHAKQAYGTTAQMVGYPTNTDADAGVMILTQRAPLARYQWQRLGADVSKLRQFKPGKKEDKVKKLILAEYGVETEFVTAYLPDSSWIHVRPLNIAH